MSVQPLEDRIVIKPADAETRTESGIYLPETAKEKPMQGKVVSVGPGRRLDNGERVKPAVKKGDIVVYGKYAGTELKLDGEEHIVLREDEVLAVITK